jgi:hypothetical protein
MKTLLLSICIALMLISCNTKKPDNATISAFTDSIPEVPMELSFPSLIPGEVELADEVFGDVVELTGTSHPLEQIFKVRGANLLAKDNQLIIKNQNGNNLFMAYSLPDFSYLGSFGREGKGPGELIHPSIIAGNIKDILISFFDVNGKVYHVNKSFEIIDSEIAFDTKRQL